MKITDFSSLNLSAILRLGESSRERPVYGNSGGPPSGRGKRGGARVIYFWHARSQHLLMLFVFPKNERSDLTAAQRRALRKTVEMEYP